MILETRDLRAGYGRMEVLRGINLGLEAGETVALIGANGAGKSTLLKALMRLAPPGGPRVTSGDILLKGSSILDVPTWRVVSELGMALVPEGRHIFGNLSVRENLVLAGSRNSTPELQAVFDLFPRLAEREKQRSDTLSGGEQQMLAVGRALMSRCDVLLLDEPSMGLAPLLAGSLFATLASLNRQGLTILLVEQNAALALETTSRAYVLEAGQIILEGPSQLLASQPEVQKAYLGE